MSFITRQQLRFGEFQIAVSDWRSGINRDELCKCTNSNDRSVNSVRTAKRASIDLPALITVILHAFRVRIVRIVRIIISLATGNNTGVPAESLLRGTLNNDILYHRLYRSRYNNEIFLCENVNPFTAPFALRVYYSYSCLRCDCTSVDELFRVTFDGRDACIRTRVSTISTKDVQDEPIVNVYVSALFRCQEPSFSVKSEVTSIRSFSERDNRGNYSSHRRIIFRMIATAAQLPIIRKILTNLSVTFHAINHLMLQLVINHKLIHNES